MAGRNRLLATPEWQPLGGKQTDSFQVNEAKKQTFNKVGVTSAF